MATITPTSVLSRGGPFAPTVTTLTASDTLTYKPQTKQVLLLTNTTGTAVTVTIDGAGGTVISPSGYGGTISVASGKEIVVGANGSQAVKLSDISAFLQGVVAVTGGVGVTAILFEG